MNKEELKKRKFLSFDVESNGLYGQAFCIAAIVFDPKGEEMMRFVGRCPIEGQVDPWVKDDVLPALEGVRQTHECYIDLLQDYMSWRKTCKEQLDVVELVHMGVPVEARLFTDAQKAGIIGTFGGPCPLVDCSAIPEIWDSPEGYLRERNMDVDASQYDGGTHNPLYDSAVAFKAYHHWLLNY